MMPRQPAGPAADSRRVGPSTARAAQWRASSYASSDGVRFLFDSIVNLATGVVVAAEAVPQAQDSGFAQLLADVAAGPGRSALDVGLAAAGVRWSVERGVRLPVHVRLSTDTLATFGQDPNGTGGAQLEELDAAVRECRDQLVAVVVDIRGPLGPQTRRDALLAGAGWLRQRGYHLLWDPLPTTGMGHASLTGGAGHRADSAPDPATGTDRASEPVSSVVSALRPEQIKLRLAAPSQPAGAATATESDTELDKQQQHIDSAQTLLTQPVRRLLASCRRHGCQVVASNIHTPAQLDQLARLGVGWGQGPLLARPSRRPAEQVYVTGAPTLATPTPRRPQTIGHRTNKGRPTTTPGTPQPTVALEARPRGTPAPVDSFVRAAATVAPTATGEQVRSMFRDAPSLGCVVMVDDHHRPVATLNRQRFLLAISGPYGHALYARRPARRLADQPRTLPATAPAHQVLDLLAQGDTHHRYDDLVITDTHGRCVGIAHLDDLLRAAATHATPVQTDPAQTDPAGPVVLTGAGWHALAPALAHHRDQHRDITVGWLVPDWTPLLQRDGLAAIDTTLHRLAHALTTAPGIDTRGPHPNIVQILDGLAVLTSPQQIDRLDHIARAALISEPELTLWTAWLGCPHPHPPTGLDTGLARLLHRARNLGPNTTLTCESLHTLDQAVAPAESAAPAALTCPAPSTDPRH